MKIFCSILFCFTFLCFCNSFIAVDTLTPNQTLQDNGQTLISSGETFELGFFSPWSSTNRYIGIWFKSISPQTVVWVANRNSPISDKSGVLMITATGNVLVLGNQSSIPIWSSNSSTVSQNPVLQLLDSGNLVVRDGSGGNYPWQSFDYPCDTVIPGMKLGLNLVTNQNWFINSWKGAQDPSTGDYTCKVDPLGLPQIVLHRGLKIVYRSGEWDGVGFGGGPSLQQNAVFDPIFVFNSTFVYYSFVNIGNNTISRLVLNQSGILQHLTWNQKRGVWVDMLTFPDSQCGVYDHCGPNGFCNDNTSPLCHCPTGFVPKAPQDWEQLDWYSGCVRRTPLNCSANEGFMKFSGVKLPDNLVMNMTVLTTKQCEEACLMNCSCTAYAITEAGECVAWFGDLLDIQEFTQGGEDLYIRMAASDLVIESGKEKRKVARLVLVALVAVLLVAIIWYVIKRRVSRMRGGDAQITPVQNGNPDPESENLDHIPLYDYLTIDSATDNFSYINKIGQGGFGAVYKGQLSTGQKVAVKRLSKDSGQGLKEFKNEVIFISMLQHRNLVRLLGCCIHGEERMLVYEYMPKKSLDLYIFDQTRGTSLDWHKRTNIIVGIARGLLYLHRDSSLRIIHRDLKASNILLDDEMDPRISDFGLAKTFGGDQNEGNTKRVMGTYGYMSPEYATEGLFSVKSDVFSFGVLVLEIVTGKKNKGFYHPDHDLNLLGHVWRLWFEERPMEIIDALMEKPVRTAEILKCIHVGLLCVQQRPEDRPTMSSVVFMLDSENPTLPQPKQPGFYTERFLTETDSSSTGRKVCSSNEVTVTSLLGR